jgi:hypothetical protein
MTKIFLRANSHRAYERLFRLVGGKENAPAHYLVAHRDNSKGYYLVEEKYLESALKIKGITKPKNQNVSDYGLCWSF